MKRKGLFFSALITVVITVLGVSIIACYNEEEKDSNSGVVYDNGTIDGTFTGKEDNYDSSYTIVFKTDGTGTYTNRVKNSGSGGDYYTYTGTLTYVMTSANGGVMRVKVKSPEPAYMDDYSVMYCFAIKGNKMYLLEGDDDAILSFDHESVSINNPNGAIDGTFTGKEDNYDSSYTIVFKTDGTGTYTNRVKSSGSGGGYYTYTGTLTYVMTSANGGVMRVKVKSPEPEYMDDYSVMFCFAIKDNMMYLLEGDDDAILSFDHESVSINKPNGAIDGTFTGKEDNYDSSYTIVFKTDGTGTYTNRVKSSGSGGGYYTYSGTLTYVMTSANGGVMCVKVKSPEPEYMDDYSVMFCFAIKDNMMYLLEGDDGLVISK